MAAPTQTYGIRSKVISSRELGHQNDLPVSQWKIPDEMVFMCNFLLDWLLSLIAPTVVPLSLEIKLRLFSRSVMMEVGAQAADGLYFVGMKEELIAAKRTVLTLDGRDVLLIHHQGEFYAIDRYCYHAGTSLQNGDIEDIDSQRCIICPKHKYKISLPAGEGLYQGRDRSQSPPPLRWFSKGVKQRVHQLTQRQGALFLRLSAAGWVESDYFQGERGRVERERAASTDSRPREDRETEREDSTE